MHPDDVADMMGDGYQNEHQRQHAASRHAFSVSRDECETDEQIARLLASGRHVAVEYQPAYCRSTDAFIGEHKSVLLHGPTRAALVAELEAQFAKEDNCLDDGRLVLLPALPLDVPARADEAGSDDGVPF
jgi:hypothetical protein